MALTEMDGVTGHKAGQGGTPQQDGWVTEVLGFSFEAAGTAGGETLGSGKGLAGKAKSAMSRLMQPKPVPRTTLGQTQKGRGDKLLAAMSPGDQDVVKNLLVKAKPAEKSYLQKALSCKHTAAELVAFEKEIRGKDKAWMEEHLHVVGAPSGKGIKQQWRDSCGPTTVQAMMGELDPIYALKLRTENPALNKADDEDGTKLNPKMAAEQKTILEGKSGKAVPRGSTEEVQGQQYGMVLAGALNDKAGSTGLVFQQRKIEDGKMAEALSGTVDLSVRAGVAVPLRLGSGAAGHFVLVTGMDEGPPKRYSIHDPWEGKTSVVTDKQLETGKFKIAGYSKVSHMFQPLRAAEPPAATAAAAPATPNTAAPAKAPGAP